MAKLSKMRNKPQVVDGHRFASKKEARRYAELKLLERAGQINNLVLHPRFSLDVEGEHICDYVGDFQYWGTPMDVVVEDVKGRKSGPAWNLFEIKAKLMMAIHGIEVKVI